MRFLNSVLLFLLGLTTASAFAAGDPAAGKLKAYTCTGCHGIFNYKNAYPTYNVPRIGGQNEAYLVIALQAYNSGLRTHKTMNSQAQSLSDQDLEDIAAYISTQPNTQASKQKLAGDAVAGKTKSTVCHACHGPVGKSTQPIYPNLGGQHADYIEKALHDYRDGTRKNPFMSGFAGALSDADIKDIAAWYGSQTGLTEIH